MIRLSVENNLMCLYDCRTPIFNKFTRIKGPTRVTHKIDQERLQYVLHREQVRDPPVPIGYSSLGLHTIDQPY